jgi:hypothetical protein
MENRNLVSASRQCSRIPVGFGQEFLSKGQCDNTGAFPIVSWAVFSWCLFVLSTELIIKGAALLWCCWHHQEWEGRAEKAFTKWFPGCFQHTYCRWQNCIIAQEDYLEGNLSSMTAVFCVFLRNKLIPGTFWSHHVYFAQCEKFLSRLWSMSSTPLPRYDVWSTWRFRLNVT